MEINMIKTIPLYLAFSFCFAAQEAEQEVNPIKNILDFKKMIDIRSGNDVYKTIPSFKIDKTHVMDLANFWYFTIRREIIEALKKDKEKVILGKMLTQSFDEYFKDLDVQEYKLRNAIYCLHDFCILCSLKS